MGLVGNTLAMAGTLFGAFALQSLKSKLNEQKPNTQMLFADLNRKWHSPDWEIRRDRFGCRRLVLSLPQLPMSSVQIERSGEKWPPFRQRAIKSGTWLADWANEVSFEADLQSDFEGDFRSNFWSNFSKVPIRGDPRGLRSEKRIYSQSSFSQSDWRIIYFMANRQWEENLKATN